MSPLDNCNHLLYFTLLDAEHAKSGSIKLETEDIFVRFIGLENRRKSFVERFTNSNHMFVVVNFFFRDFMLERSHHFFHENWKLTELWLTFL